MGGDRSRFRSEGRERDHVRTRCHPLTGQQCVCITCCSAAMASVSSASNRAATRCEVAFAEKVTKAARAPRRVYRAAFVAFSANATSQRVAARLPAEETEALAAEHHVMKTSSALL